MWIGASRGEQSTRAAIWTELEAVARLLSAELGHSSGEHEHPSSASKIDGPMGGLWSKLPLAGIWRPLILVGCQARQQVGPLRTYQPT